MKNTAIVCFFFIAFSFLFASCEEQKVGQFKTIPVGQPIAIGYDHNLLLNPGDTVRLWGYTDGWALANPDHPDSLCVKAIFVK